MRQKDRRDRRKGDDAATRALESTRRDALLARIVPDKVAPLVEQEVLGQDEWVQAIARFAYQQVRRGSLIASGTDPATLPGMGVLLGMGPTASGKTFAIRSYCRATGIECVYQSCATLTGEGWQGESVSDSLSAVAEAQRRARGLPVLVVFDEADKLRVDPDERYPSFNAMKDFLAPLDGGTYRRQAGSGSMRDRYEVDMDNLVIVFLGAFTGIEDVVRARLSGAGSFGLVGTGEAVDASRIPDDELRSKVTVDDLESWGFMREFCGRIGAIHDVPALGRETMLEIARQSVGKASNLMPDGCVLKVTSAAVAQVAERALASGVGARGVNTTIGELAARALATATADGGICSATVRVAGGDLVLGYARGERRSPAGRGAASVLEDTQDESDASRMARLVDATAAGAAAAVVMGGHADLRPLARCVVSGGGAGTLDTGQVDLLEAVLTYLRDMYPVGSPDRGLGWSWAYLDSAKPTQPDGRSPLDLVIDGTVDMDGFYGYRQRLCDLYGGEDAAREMPEWRAVEAYGCWRQRRVRSRAQDVADMVGSLVDPARSAKVASAIARAYEAVPRPSDNPMQKADVQVADPLQDARKAS